MTHAMSAAFTSAQVDNMSTDDLVALTSAALRALSTDALAALDSTQIGALSNAQVAALTTGQIATAISNRFRGRVLTSLPDDKHPRVHVNAAGKPVAVPEVIRRRARLHDDRHVLRADAA